METWQTIAVFAAVIVFVVAMTAYFYQRNRTHHLQSRFGPEYERRLAETGSRWRAEADLARRESIAEKLRVRPLDASDRLRFLEEWRICQVEFVDDPARALDHADRVVANIMRTRGYAADNPNDRVADVCAAYPRHASAYREANEIVLRQRSGNASTEDLRAAFLKFRTLFDEMLGGRDEELRRAS